VQCDRVSLDKFRFDNKPTHGKVGQRLQKNKSEEKQDKTKHEVKIKEVNIKIKVHEYTSLDVTVDPNEN
jgi:hypothetical protein